MGFNFRAQRLKHCPESIFGGKVELRAGGDTRQEEVEDGNKAIYLELVMEEEEVEVGALEESELEVKGETEIG